MKSKNAILVGTGSDLIWYFGAVAMVFRGLRGDASIFLLSDEEMLSFLERRGKQFNWMCIIGMRDSPDARRAEEALTQLRRLGVKVEWMANWTTRAKGELVRRLHADGLLTFLTEDGTDCGLIAPCLAQRFGIDMEDLESCGDLVINGYYVVSSPPLIELLYAGQWFYESYGQNEVYTETVRLMAERVPEKDWGRQIMEALAHYRRFGRRGLLGRSDAMCRLRQKIRNLRDAPDVRVMILGETGTGKETVAMQIHYGSTRRKGKFVPFNCAAVSPGLLESRFFGYEKGAFTGADRRTAGLFETANGGTLFLDEIGELNLEAQAMLLRVLEEGAFMRVGGTEELTVNVRLITATNRDLVEMVKAGTFRADLYQRLSVVQIRIPPLREHLEDIPGIVAAWNSLRQKPNTRYLEGPTDEQVEHLKAYDYPGNVRELLNLLERAVAFKETDFSKLVNEHAKMNAGLLAKPDRGRTEIPDDLEGAARMHVHRIYEKYGRNLTKAAEALKVSRNTVRKYL